MAKNVDYSDWKVQLAYPIEKAKLNKDEWICITQKINGCRATFFGNQLVSRSGKIFKGLGLLNNQLLELRINTGPNCHVLDGELVLLPQYRSGNDTADFQEAVGIANSTVDMSNKHKLQFVIFDTMTPDEFINENSKNTYYSRLFNLNYLQLFIAEHNEFNLLKTVPIFYAGYDHSQINIWSDYAETHNMEGIMINRDWPYEFKRTKGLLKVKVFKTADLKVIGFTQGEGKYKDTLGAIIVGYGDNVVCVGSGFTDSMRNEVWNNKDKYLGKICEVKYKAETENKETGLKSIEFPVFLCFRDDKEIADEV